MHKGPRNVLNDLQSGPWTKKEEAGKGAGQISARWLAGGEGQGARELEEIEANLLVGLGVAWDARRVVVGDGQSTAAEDER